MFVLGEGGPHAAVDAVAGTGEEGSWGVLLGGGEGTEDEFWGGETRDVGLEEGAPWGGLRHGGVRGRGGHCF